MVYHIFNCFERIVIGERLLENAISRNASELTTRECEQLCKRDKQCQTYDYGVGAKGNATCNLSNMDEKELKEKALIQRHPDYDVYIRRFQCEQAPPTPIQAQFDDPETGPVHRPSFRPDNERPLVDHDISDSTFDTNRPKPYYNNYLDIDRPDDYDNSRPTYNRPPTYGVHKPQDIPYKPVRYNHTSHRPDPLGPHDVLHFQDPYQPLWKPNPYPEYIDRPGQRPIYPYMEEKPEYHYIIRPNRKPQTKPQDDFVNNKPAQHYPKPDYNPGHPEGPIGPPNKPYRPRPSYDSQKPDRPNHNDYGQYASNYGQNYHGNSLYLEIYDPPRPYRPSRPLNDRPDYDNNQSYGQSYGYGSYFSQNSYSHNQNSHLYGTGTTAGLDYDQHNYNRPSYPQRPNYIGTETGYGSPISHKPGSYQKPSQAYGDHNSNSEGYGSSNHGYGSNRPSYNDRPIYNEYRPPYVLRPSFDESLYNRPTYEDVSPDKPNNISHPIQTSNIPSYGDNVDSKPSRPRPSYGKPPYEDEQRPYEGNNYSSKPSYNENRPTRPLYNDNIPGYGENRPSYGSNLPASGSNQPYGSDRPYESNQSHGSNQPSYNVNQSTEKPNYTDHDSNRPDIRPVYEYELEKPFDVPSYIVKPNGDIITSKPMTISDFGERPGYGRHPGHLVSYKACFRRVLAGQRAVRSHVRKVIHCERLEDCRHECAEEIRFHCESFNYRLDPTFRGKGLCELMTKPIEAFDLRRDFVEDKEYDFYEIDRNSLEPNCPESLRGPGLLHSGFLSSKPAKAPEYQNWDRDSQETRYRGHNRFYDGRHSERHRFKYFEDQFFVPYQIGVSSRSNDDQENWGTYGGDYGGFNSYYKDRNDYHKSVNHWRLDDVERPYYRKPLDNSNFNYHNLGKKEGFYESYGYGTGAWKRGRWNNSGTEFQGLDYGESNYNKGRPYYDYIGRTEETNSKDCTSRRRPGMSLSSGAIRRSLFARNVVVCETACFNEQEFKCVSYSYRYSSSPGSDNCFLSERPYQGLELSADSGSDVYAMQHHCSSSRPWLESECFWHVRSGAAVNGGSVRAALTVAGLGACEAECIRADGFFCRGFSFRFDSPAIGDDLENCLLTSSPPTSLDSRHGLRPTAGHELYARGNYGRGCEPALYDDLSHKETGECYLQYDNAAKLIGSAVRGQARVKDEMSCGSACTNAPFRCLSFSYNNYAPPHIDNCLLSEIRLFDLQRGVDYEHSLDDWLFSFDLFNGQCWRKVHAKDYDEPSLEVPRPLPPPAIVESYPGIPSGPGDLPDSHFLPGSGPSGPAYKPYPTGPEIKPGYLPETGPGFKPSFPPGHIPESGYDSSGPFKPGYSEYNPTKPSYPPSYKPSYPPINLKPGYPPSGIGDHEYKPEYIPSSVSDPGYKPGYIPSSVSDPGYKPGYLPSSGSGPGYKPGYFPGASGYPSSSGVSKPYPPSGGSGGYRPGYLPSGSGPGYKPEYSLEAPGPWSKPNYDGDKELHEPTVSWRHYTVSGFPCRQGTSCAQNQIAGHWACEPEGGEIGSWDYCCAPTHRCGYSEGFSKPWCYVGPEKDQWRPCSEKYYPYHQHNVPHPSQAHDKSDSHRPHSRPFREKPIYIDDRDKPHGPYLSQADRKYWDDLYNNGPQAYYDKYGNPLPGYTRVPTAERPYIKFRHNYPRPGSGHWVPVSGHQPEFDPSIAGGLGAPRYWPVAYLHKGPPPNMTYFKYNETDRTTTEKYNERPLEPPTDRPSQFKRVNLDNPNENKVEARSYRDEKTRNISRIDNDIFKLDTNDATTTIKPKSNNTEVKETISKQNKSNTESTKQETNKSQKEDLIKGIDGKLVDFSTSIEVFDIEDAKKEGKSADLKMLEAEEKQIEEIGRLLASRRNGQIILEKRSQKDLESKKIALDKDLIDFNFGNRFPTTERRGVVQKVSKDEIEREKKYDKSLEVSETTFVRPPRVLSTTENIRKAIVNGKVFYDATIREQRDIFANTTRRSKSRALEESKGPTVISNSNFGKKKVIRARNANPVRRVRRVYRKRYNPEEVRRRLLEREKSKNDNADKKE